MTFLSTNAEDGGVDLDQMIGSILERWLTTHCRGKCRFCRRPLLNPDVDSKDQFCDDRCKADWMRVMEARIAIGKRDLRQRGYD